MRKIILIITALAALVAASPAASATVAVSITRAGFVPDQVSIRVGDTVTWTNADTQPHQVTSTERGETFTSPPLQPGQTYSHTYRNAGRFTVIDPLNRNRRMTVNVAAAPVSITAAARPATITYGGSSTLSGVLSTQQANERVTVFVQACGASTFTRVADVTTTTGGAWSYVVKPTMNTTYRVQYRNAATATVAVKVRPRVTLRKLLSPRRFVVRVFAARTFGGRFVTMQRFNASTGSWVRVKTVGLRTLGTGVSGATFRAAVRVRTRVRVVMPQSQVTACYVAGTSNAVRA